MTQPSGQTQVASFEVVSCHTGLTSILAYNSVVHMASGQ